MSRLIKIAGWSDTPRASVVFVHGLGGHAYDTWQKAPDSDTFWPLWLAEDLEGISVYTLAYEAPPSNWLGTSMPLQDRAVNVLEHLLSEQGLKSGTIAFICHSLGGLIVKQILLDLQQQKERRKEAIDLLNRVTQVVFAATPHTGSRQGTLLDRLRFFAWPSTIARTLVANDPTLRSINVAYRGLADERRNVLQHRVFYETQGTPTGVIVDEASADPGLPGDPPVPLDADHISIVKPFDRSSILYARTRNFIAENLAPPMQDGRLEICTLPPIRSEQSLNIVPKLIRIAAIGLVLLIGYKGVQALIAPTLPIDPKEIVQLKENVQQLTRQLITLNAANAGPGLNRAVNEAVAATAKGAAEGDRRLQQAFDMLKANKIAGATQLLQTVAADKAASIEKDRKDAAAAYRNLGAIAGLRDPAKASEAYAKALEFDPDDRDALYWRGWLSLQAGHLAVADQSLTLLLKLASEVGDQQGIYRASLRLGELALARGNLALDLEYQNKAEKVAFEKMVSNPANSEWQRNLSVSYEKVGDVQQAQGDLKAALKSYGEDLAIAERLAQSDPGNAGWQRDLSLSYERIGDVQVVQGNLTAAHTSYSDSLAILERLAQSDPGNAGWQRDLSLSYERIGDVQVAQGDLKAALKSYGEDLAITERLAQSDPGNAGWQRDLSVSYDNIGDVQVAQGDLKAALKSYSDSLAIRERSAQSDPGNADWQRNLSVSYDNIGNVQVAQGDLKAALKSYSDSLAIFERLAKSDPGNAGWQRDLSVSYEKIGDVQRAQGDLKAALKSYSDSLAIAERLAKADPGNAGWQRDLSISYVKIGDVQVAQGDLQGALKSYSDGLAIRERLATSDPGNAGWQRDLSVSYNKIGDVQIAQGDLKTALKSYSDGLAIKDRLATSDRGNAGWQRGLSISYEKIGDVQWAQRDLKTALKSYSNSLAIRERLAQSDPGNADWQRDLSVGYAKIGDVQWAEGDLKTALKSYSNSLAIRGRLAQSDPGNADWQRELSVGYAKLADAYSKSNETAKVRDALAAGRAIVGKLVEQHPDQAQWKQDLAWFDARIGIRRHKKRNP